MASDIAETIMILVSTSAAVIVGRSAFDYCEKLYDRYRMDHPKEPKETLAHPVPDHQRVIESLFGYRKRIDGTCPFPNTNPDTCIGRLAARHDYFRLPET